MGGGETLSILTKLPASVLSLLSSGKPRPEAAVSIPAVVPEEMGSFCRDPGASHRVLRGDLLSAPHA